MSEGVLFFVLIKMFDQTALLVISLSLFYSSSALRCTTNCSFSADFTTPFSIPDHCDQLIEAEKCVGNVAFWFNLDKYNVNLEADDSSSSMGPEENRHSVLLDLSSNTPGFFSHSIDRACNDRDDCARDLITDMTNEMLQRDYNHTTILAELQPLISDSIVTPYDYELQCYNSQHNVEECGTPLAMGSCLIINKISHNKISLQCNTEIFPRDIHVIIYEEIHDHCATLHIQCNGSLCNTRSTLREVKEVLYRHGVTVTPDGRLV